MMRRAAMPIRVRARQRGLASLVVVMILFFIVSMMAAYTSRNLIFEQKTSANLSRNTMAFEVADAGVEWTLAQLNGGTIGDDCTNAAATTNSFQQRYLTITTSTGMVDHVVRTGNWPTCMFDGTAWACTCPDATTLTPAAPAAGDVTPHPAFRVWPATNEPVAGALPTATLNPLPLRTGMLWVSVAGCTVLPQTADQKCLDYPPEGDIGDGMAATRVAVLLSSGLPTPPAAAVTARQLVSPMSGVAAKLRVVNTDTRAAGITVNTGEAIDRSLFSAQTLPGTPGETSFVENDVRLNDFSLHVAPAPTTPPGATALSSGERMFVSIFGKRRQTYLQQPGLRICPSPCDGDAIAALMAANPNRVIWAEGNVTLNRSIGTAPSAPVLLIVNGGTLTLDPDVRVFGFVYLTGGVSATSTIVLPSAPTWIQGALVAEGSLVTSYGGGGGVLGNELTVTYDRDALDVLRTSYGSWVRQAGGWRDFKMTTS